MKANEIVLHVVDSLERAGIGYMLVGSYSSNVHGIPRSTEDADFVIELSSSDSIARVAEALGPDLKLDPQLSFETVTGNYRFIITHAHSCFKVELFLLSSDAHHQQRFARRERQTLESRKVWFQTAEDVIIQKLRWYIKIKRSKDRDDVVDVLDTCHEKIDLIYTRFWCAEHGTLVLFEELLADAKALDGE